MLSQTLVVTAFVAIAAAQSSVLTFTHVPNPVTDGQPQAITYATNDTSSPVTIILRQGEASNLKTIETLTTTATGGQFIWTPSTSLPDGINYALEITQGNQVNYFGPLEVQGATASSSTSMSSSSSTTGVVAHSSSSSSSSMSNNSSMSSTSSIGTMSSGNSTTMSRNTTMSSATLSSTSSAKSSPASNTATATSSGLAATAASSAASASSTSGASPVEMSGLLSILFGAAAAAFYL